MIYERKIMKRKDNQIQGKKLNYICTRETLGMTLLLFCAIVALMLFTGSGVFGPVGKGICTFLYGTFGYGSYLVVACLAYLGVFLTFEKKIRFTFWRSLVAVFSVTMLFLLFHCVSTRNYELTGYGNYIADCYKNAANGFSGYTFGGVISAVIVYPVISLGFSVGYVLFALLCALSGYLIYLVYFKKGVKEQLQPEVVAASQPQPAAQPVAEQTPAQPEPVATAQPQQYQPVAMQSPYQQYSQPQYSQPQPTYEKPAEEDKFSDENLGRKVLFEKGEFAAESYRRNMIFNENSYFNHPVTTEADYLSSFSSGKSSKPTKRESYTQSYQQEVVASDTPAMPSSYVYGDKPAQNLNDYESVEPQSYDSTTDYDYTKLNDPRSFAPDPEPEIEEDDGFADEIDDTSDEIDIYANYDKPMPEPEPEPEEQEDMDDFGNIARPEESSREEIRPERERGRDRSKAFVFENFDDDEDDVLLGGRAASTEPPRDLSRREESRGRDLPLRDSGRPADETQKDREQPIIERRTQEPREIKQDNHVYVETPKKPEETIEPPPKHVWKPYVRPDLQLLDDYPENSNVNTAEIEDNKRTIVAALDRYKIASHIANVTVGPAITRYDVIIEDKTKIKTSLNYRDAIAMELRKENVNAYLNYSKGALSIEVPNANRSIVGLKSMLASSKFINCKPNSLSFALGKNLEGEVVCPDITKMPHLLVAGTTGSGKSICLSALLISLLYKYGPEELRLILVDPKQVEFISYDKLPHLMINEIIYDVDKAIKALNWANKEMERRYTLFKDMTEAGVATKSIDEYNQHIGADGEKLPKIVIILDEFGDLMLQAKKDIETRIIKLVQKARACGIHLILATQRPSVDCITGLIKSNLPTRIGFKVNSFDDARTIFDIGGAEKLLGKGDLYFRSAESPELARIQGCFVDTHEVQKVTDFIKANNETYFDQAVSDFINKVDQPAESNSQSLPEGEEGGDSRGIDDKYIAALKYCIMSNQASVSMIQRRFPVGYVKACKIIDWMTNMDYITQAEGSKPRKILLTKEEFINKYGEDVDD